MASRGHYRPLADADRGPCFWLDRITKKKKGVSLHCSHTAFDNALPSGPAVELSPYTLVIKAFLIAHTCL